MHYSNVRWSIIISPTWRVLTGKCSHRHGKCLSMCLNKMISCDFSMKISDPIAIRILSFNLLIFFSRCRQILAIRHTFFTLTCRIMSLTLSIFFYSCRNYDKITKYLRRFLTTVIWYHKFNTKTVSLIFVKTKKEIYWILKPLFTPRNKCQYFFTLLKLPFRPFLFQSNFCWDSFIWIFSDEKFSKVSWIFKESQISTDSRNIKDWLISKYSWISKDSWI